MPMTLGPISIAAAPGTGSFWLQQLLSEPKKGLGLGRGEVLKPKANGEISVVVRKAEARDWDRHCPGPCTVTVVRNVDTLLRSWFLRFRKPPPPLEAIIADPKVLHPGKFYIYLADINVAIDYWGPDFKTWLDAYLDNAPGSVTALLERFTSLAANVLHQEDLVNETICFLHRQQIKFDEQKVRDYPRLSVHAKGKPPEWPEGYAAKIREAG